MSGAGRGNAFVFCGIAFANGEGFLPILPIFILQLDGDGRTDRHALTDAGKDMCGVALDLHAAAAAIALLAAPEFAVDERLIDFQSRRQAGKEGDQSLAVRFSGSEITQHKRSIVPDGWDGTWGGDFGEGLNLCGSERPLNPN